MSKIIMCKRLTKEDYLKALPEKVRDRLRKILQGESAK